MVIENMKAFLLLSVLSQAVFLMVSGNQLDCSFDTNYCQWNQVQGNKLDWKINPLRGGTGSGHNEGYAFFDGNEAYTYPGDKAQLISPAITIPSGQTECLSFVYNMKGRTFNSLNIYQKLSTGRMTRLFSEHTDQSIDWSNVRINLTAATDFQVVIEGIKGATDSGPIYLDDLKSVSGLCPPSGQQNFVTFGCDFDTDMCGWVQSSDDDMDWTRQRGGTQTLDTGPFGDHTSGNGFYLYTEVSTSAPNKTARLSSGNFSPSQTAQCFSFWYNMHGDHIGTLNVYVKTSNTTGVPEWTRTGAQGSEWIQATITLTEFQSPYSIVIEGVSGNGFLGDIAIDDIKMVDGSCSDVIVAGPTVRTTNKPGETVRACTFEVSNICSYVQDKTDDFDWTRIRHTTNSYDTGPSDDHTYGTSSGYYMFIEASKKKTGSKARIMTPVYHDSSAMCVQFYYHMYGDGMGSFNVYASPEKSGTSLGPAIFSMSGNQGNKWNVAEASIPLSTATSPSGYRVMFEGVTGTNYKSDVAIDDISFKAGPCPNPGDCTFEKDLCTWENTPVGDNFDWIQDYGSSYWSKGPAVDHSLGNAKGQYMYIKASRDQKPGDKAWLVSQNFPPVASAGRCMNFWYSMSGRTVDAINIYIRVPDRTDYMIWHLSGNHSDQWYNGQIPITETSKSYSIVIEGVRGTNFSSYLAVDDITFFQSPGLCQVLPANAVAPPQTTQQVTTKKVSAGSFDCGFEYTLCGWYQKSDIDDFDWQRISGPSLSIGTGAEVDHTYRGSWGHYLYIETSSPRKQGDKAQLYGPEVSAGEYCVSFWTTMFGQDVGALNVYIQTCGGQLDNPVWRITGDHGPDWLKGTISVNEKTPFTVVFEGVRGNGYMGDIALDDINIKNGSCPDHAGHYPHEVNLFTDAKFRRVLQGPAVSRSTVYAEVISLSHQPVAMALDSCTAVVNSTNTAPQKSYPLIREKTESTTAILMVKPELVRFRFEMPPVADPNDVFHVTCAVTFCGHMDLSPRCQQRCQVTPAIIG